MSQVELKQCYDFRQSDFISNPIWMCVFNIDVDEPWYDETDEATYRPWPGPPPYRCSGLNALDVIVRAQFTLADGTKLEGFARPPSPPDGDAGYSLGFRQPALFLPGGSMIGFWLGGRESCEPDRGQFYSELRKTPSQVFPIMYQSFPGLIDTPDAGSIDGFH